MRLESKPEVDAYIAKAAPFAQPVLEHMRELMHKAGPDLNETIKWSMPFFVYKGVDPGKYGGVQGALQPRACGVPEMRGDAEGWVLSRTRGWGRSAGLPA